MTAKATPVPAAFAHRTPDYAIAYKRIGFPVGLLVGIAALLYLGVQWSRRMVRMRRQAS